MGSEPRLVGREALAAALASSSRARGPLRRNKYGVAPKEERTRGEVLFASKAEARRFDDLETLRRAGVVRFFLRQVPFHLPGRRRYLLDFLVFWADGHQSFEDVKGVRTEMYRLKRDQVRALYGVVVEELGRRGR